MQSVETPKPVKTNTNTTSKLDIYDPKNLNDDERKVCHLNKFTFILNSKTQNYKILILFNKKKIISSMLNRATLFYKEKSDDDDENSDWVSLLSFFTNNLTKNKSWIINLH